MGVCGAKAALERRKDRTMKPQVLMAGIVAAVALTGFVAAAQDRRQTPDFATLDADGDGLVTAEEIAAHGQTRFDAADTDADGAISAEEFATALAARQSDRADRMFDRLDANNDGSLSADELERPRQAERLERMIARADTDDDGALNAEEFEAVKERRGEGRRGGGKHRDRG